MNEKIDLDRIGGIVRVGRRMTSYYGPTVAFWGRFKCDVENASMVEWREGLVEAYALDGEAPPGFVEAVGFDRWAPKCPACQGACLVRWVKNGWSGSDPCEVCKGRGTPQ